MNPTNLVPVRESNRKQTVLFVDDESNVLEGLRRATRRLRSVWDVHFAESGVAALQVLDGMVVDVVVSDMRMPGMDGGELLSRVREKSPLTSRIILSGQADHEAVYKAIGPAHQYLTKPCDIDVLVNVVERLGVRPSEELTDPIRTLIGQVDRLPTQPELFVRLTEVLERESSSLADVAGLLTQDPGMSTEILRVVNSAFFGTFGNVESVANAVSLLGIDVIRGLILGNRLFDPRRHQGSWLKLEDVALRSRLVAAAARGLALRAGASTSFASKAYLAGMVAEVGLLVMALHPAEPTTAAVVNRAYFEHTEVEVFGGNRFAVGAHLLRLWGFKDDVVEAVSGLGATLDPPVHSLGWYLRAGRRLVLEAGVSAAELADPAVPIESVDVVLAQMGRHSDASPGG